MAGKLSDNESPMEHNLSVSLPLGRRRTLWLHPRLPSHIQDFCLNIESSISSPEATVHKDDHAAKVVSCRLGNLHCVVKQHNPRRWYKALRRGFGISKARLAWRGADLLKRCNIPTVQPIALIEDRLGLFCFRSFFIAEYLHGTNAREYFQSQALSQTECLQAMEQIRSSLQGMHNQGIAHGDTKDTNIVFSNNCLCWLDCEAVSPARDSFLGRRKKRKDWQILHYNWRGLPQLQRTLLQTLQEHCSRAEYTALVKDCVRYTKRRLKPARDRVASGVTDEAVIRSSKQLLEASSTLDWERVRSSENAIVARTTAGLPALYCKIFLPRSRFEHLKSFVLRSRVERAVRGKQLLAAAGFRVSEVVYWDSQQGVGTMVTRAASGEPLDEYFKRSGSPLSRSEKWKRSATLRELGRQVGSMHECGFVHGDLRLSNILVSFHGEYPELHLLDNERTRFYSRVPKRLIVKNLTQINVDARMRLSRSERLRIFRAYQEVRGRLEPERERRLLSRIFKRTRKRMAASRRGSS